MCVYIYNNFFPLFLSSPSALLPQGRRRRPRSLITTLIRNGMRCAGCLRLPILPSPSHLLYSTSAASISLLHFPIASPISPCMKNLFLHPQCPTPNAYTRMHAHTHANKHTYAHTLPNAHTHTHTHTRTHSTKVLCRTSYEIIG